MRTYQHFALKRGSGEDGGERVGVGWEGGSVLKAGTESEMEHVAYREISTDCSVMNAPLYLRYDGRRRWYKVFFPAFHHSLSLVPKFSLETKQKKSSEDVGSFRDGCSATLTVRTEKHG